MIPARWKMAVVVALGVAVSACSAPTGGGAPAGKPAAGQPAAQAPAQPAAQAPAKPPAEKVVRISVPRSVGASFIWAMDDTARKYGIKIEPIAALTNADMQRAAQSGQAEAASLGYQSPAILASQGVNNVVVVAGLTRGSQNLIMRKEVQINSWKDLEGKKIGRPPGTFVGILFTLAARVNGVDLSRVNIVDTTAAGTTELQALKNGDLDGFLLWSPTIDKAVTDGYGYYPACCDVGGTKEYGSGNQVIGVNADFLKDRPTAVNFLKAYVEAMDLATKNQDRAIENSVQITGADRAAIAEAFKHFSWDYRVDLETAVNIAKQGQEFGFTQSDVSGRVKDFIDYSFLAEATGKRPEELSTFGQ